MTYSHMLYKTLLQDFKKNMNPLGLLAIRWIDNGSLDLTGI